MRRRRVGGSGLEVSQIGLGTMTWGADTDVDGAAAQLATFVDAGGTLVETADGYGDGAAQATLGEVLTSAVPRDDLVALSGTVPPAARCSRLSTPPSPVSASTTWTCGSCPASTPTSRWRRRSPRCRWP